MDQMQESRIKMLLKDMNKNELIARIDWDALSSVYEEYSELVSVRDKAYAAAEPCDNGTCSHRRRRKDGEIDERFGLTSECWDLISAATTASNVAGYAGMIEFSQFVNDGCLPIADQINLIHKDYLEGLIEEL